MLVSLTGELCEGWVNMRWTIVGLIAMGVGGCASETALTDVDGVRTVGRSFAPTAADGAVVVECVVRPDGRLADCAVLSERPVGRGYGEAALISAREARIRIDENEPYSPGAKIRYTVRFREEGARRP